MRIDCKLVIECHWVVHIHINDIISFAPHDKMTQQAVTKLWGHFDKPYLRNNFYMFMLVLRRCQPIQQGVTSRGTHERFNSYLNLCDQTFRMNNWSMGNHQHRPTQNGKCVLLFWCNFRYDFEKNFRKCTIIQLNDEIWKKKVPKFCLYVRPC